MTQHNSVKALKEDRF